MSNALAVVRFKDGTLLYTQYQGSTDSLYPALFHNAEEAWSYDRHDKGNLARLQKREPLIEPEDIEVQCSYAGGAKLTGRACKKSMTLEIDYPEGWF